MLLGRSMLCQDLRRHLAWFPLKLLFLCSNALRLIVRCFVELVIFDQLKAEVVLSSTSNHVRALSIVCGWWEQGWPTVQEKAFFLSNRRRFIKQRLVRLRYGGEPAAHPTLVHWLWRRGLRGEPSCTRRLACLCTAHESKHCCQALLSWWLLRGA